MKEKHSNVFYRLNENLTKGNVQPAYREVNDSSAGPSSRQELSEEVALSNTDASIQEKEDKSFQSLMNHMSSHASEHNEEADDSFQALIQHIFSEANEDINATKFIIKSIAGFSDQKPDDIGSNILLQKKIQAGFNRDQNKKAIFLMKYLEAKKDSSWNKNDLTFYEAKEACLLIKASLTAKTIRNESLRNCLLSTNITGLNILRWFITQPFFNKLEAIKTFLYSRWLQAIQLLFGEQVCISIQISALLLI